MPIKIEIDVDKAKRLYAKGYTLKHISELFFVSRNTISNRFKSIGYKYPSRQYQRHITQEQIDLINNLHGTIPIKELMHRVGFSKMTIYKYLRR